MSEHWQILTNRSEPNDRRKGRHLTYLPCKYHSTPSEKLSGNSHSNLSHSQSPLVVAALWTETSTGPIAFELLLDDTSALPLVQADRAQGYGAVQYYIVAEALTNGWVLWGEPDKIIPLSRQRVDSIDVVVHTSSVVVHLLGAAGEQGTFLFQHWGSVTSGASTNSSTRSGEVRMDVAPALLRCPFQINKHGNATVGASLSGCN